MHTIIEKKKLSEQVYMMRVDAPLIAEARSPGQFIILQVNTEFGERIPLTISDANAEEGWIRIIFQALPRCTPLQEPSKRRATSSRLSSGPGPGIW